jgi:hypothetical protein
VHEPRDDDCLARPCGDNLYPTHCGLKRTTTVNELKTIWRRFSLQFDQILLFASSRRNWRILIREAATPTVTFPTYKQNRSVNKSARSTDFKFFPNLSQWCKQWLHFPIFAHWQRTFLVQNFLAVIQNLPSLKLSS